MPGVSRQTNTGIPYAVQCPTSTPTLPTWISHRNSLGIIATTPAKTPNITQSGKLPENML